MEKPISIKRAEMIERIYTAINAAQLPAFVVSDVLKGILATAEEAAQHQLQQDLAAYSQEQKQDNEEG